MVCTQVYQSNRFCIYMNWIQLIKHDGFNILQYTCGMFSFVMWWRKCGTESNKERLLLLLIIHFTRGFMRHSVCVSVTVKNVILALFIYGF